MFVVSSVLDHRQPLSPTKWTGQREVRQACGLVCFLTVRAGEGGLGSGCRALGAVRGDGWASCCRSRISVIMKSCWGYEGREREREGEREAVSCAVSGTWSWAGTHSHQNNWWNEKASSDTALTWEAESQREIIKHASTCNKKGGIFFFLNNKCGKKFI